MKFFILSLFFTYFAQAQVVIAPIPVNGNIELSKIQSYVYFTNPSLNANDLNLNLGSNSNGIKLGITRCSPPVRKYQSCYVIVSFDDYIYNTQEINIPLKNGNTVLANLLYHPVISSNLTSSFTTSSIIVNDFNLVSVIIQNNTSTTKTYNPVLSGIDGSKYKILLNRCQNVINNGTCLVYFKLNPQKSGIYSAVLSESQVSNTVDITSSITNLTQGVIPPTLESISVSPSSLNFGTIKNLGKTSSKAITITNNGNVAISPIITVSGSGIEIALNRCLSPLPPGQSCSVSLVINATSNLANGTQSGLFISSKATSSSTPIFTTVSATLSVNPALISAPVVNVYTPTFSNYSTLNVCDGTLPVTRTITSCFGVSENSFVSLNKCTDPAPSIVAQSPAGNITNSIVSSSETFSCALGSSTQVFMSRTCNGGSVDNGVFCSTDLLYFGARSGGNGTGFELYVSDGSSSGTKLVKEINPGVATSSVADSEFFSFNGKAFF